MLTTGEREESDGRCGGVAKVQWGGEGKGDRHDASFVRAKACKSKGEKTGK